MGVGMATGNTAQVDIDRDEEYARSLEQQFQDERVARGMQERENASRSGAAVAAAREADGEAVRRTRTCTVRYMLCRVFLPAAGLVAIVWTLLALAFPHVIQPFLDPDDLPPFFTDNWGAGWGVGDGPAGEGYYGPYQKWMSPPATKDKTGLHLPVVNALTEEWFGYFSEAVIDWQAGPPSSVKLTVRVSEFPEPECKHVKGIMKVCNGNYGRTQWTGLNEVVFQNSHIISSTAKMNEFYLRNSGVDERQYVMCHEMGHGFGLPHRDEDPMNADIGSCLDYTSRPANNRGPDSVDYTNLADLYGTLPGSDDGGAVSEAEAGSDGKRTMDKGGGGNSGTTSDGVVTAANGKGGGAHGGRRKTREQEREPAAAVVADSLENLSALDRDRDDGRRRWREGGGEGGDGGGRRPGKEGRRGVRTLLHRSDRGEAYEIDLGDGQRKVVSVLY